MGDASEGQPLVRHGEYKVQANGGMTLPAEIRRAMGMADGGRVLIFSQPGRVIITPSPLAEELLAFASELGAARAAELVADDGPTVAASGTDT